VTVLPSGEQEWINVSPSNSTSYANACLL